MLRPTAQMHFAHKGLHAWGVPPNSLAAMIAAVDAGYGIELDVQVTRDGIPFVLHDANTLVEFGLDINVATADAVDLDGLHHLGTQIPISRLSDVLTSIPTSTPLLVDLKAEVNFAHATVATCALLRDRVEATALLSFHPKVLKRARVLVPGLAVGLLGEEANDQMSWTKRLQTRTLLSNYWFRPDFIAWYLPMLKSRQARFWQKRIPGTLLGWTVVDEEDLELCRSLGVSMIFENVRP